MERDLVGLRIKRLREENNLNQTELGKMIGKTQATVNKYEKGEVTIPSDILFLISKALNTSTNYILCGEEPVTDETTQLLEELHKNPDLKVLLYEGSKASPESLKAIIQLIKSNK